MSRKFFGEHGKRYAQCGVCLRVLKFGDRQRTTGSHSQPFIHCGKPTRFLKDSEAREIVEGRPFKGARRLVGKVASREAYVKRVGR